MLSLSNIFETINMIDKQHLDIRTITMGISLLDCISEDPKRCCDKIYSCNVILFCNFSSIWNWSVNWNSCYSKNY